MPPACSVTSAIRGLPTTMVAILPGTLTSVAWSTLTDILFAIVGAARPKAGHSKSPATRERRAERATTRLRRKLNPILSSGTLTSRQKRYAAEPAPDRPNLATMCEIIAKSCGKMLSNSTAFLPLRAAPAPAGARKCGPSLAPERIGDLARDLVREARLLLDAIIVGQLPF